MQSIFRKVKITILIGFVLNLLSCANSAIDRGYVNDPAMLKPIGQDGSGLSPFSGLKNRGQTTGGSSCAVCAH